MEKLSLTNRAFIYLGNKVGETQRLAIDNIGTAFVSPIAMIISTKFKPSKTERQKQQHDLEIKYQALRSPISAVIGYSATRLFYQPFTLMMNSLAMQGKLPGYMNSTLLFETVHNDSPQAIMNILDHRKLSLKTRFQITYLYSISKALHQAEKNDKKYPNAKEMELFVSNKIRGLLNSEQLDQLQKKSLKKVLIVTEQKQFKAYRQLHQSFLYMVIVPFTMILLNYTFPPFVSYFFPSLDKEVRKIK